VIAVDSLVKVLSKEDPRSLSELKERSSDPNIYVKREVIKTLRTFLPNNNAANNLVSFLGDLDYQTRLAAMEALPRV
jgi:HEAT repeat protein